MTPQQAEYLIDHRCSLARCLEELSRGLDGFRLRKELEAEHPPEMCRALLDCASSQHRFHSKFERASEWLLTREAAEQASHHLIARWRSNFVLKYFPEDSITEVGSGVGGDTVALSRRHSVRGFEQDPARALLCRENLRQLGDAERGRILAQEAVLEELRGELLFCDPARRAQQRISKPEDWLPSLPSVLETVKEDRFHSALVKVAPGLDFERCAQQYPGLTACFLSVDGALKECQLLLSSSPRGLPAKQAILLSSRGGPAQILQSLKQALPHRPPVSGEFLHNPDPAILRADALDNLGQALSAALVHPKIGYLVGPTPCSDNRAQSFEVLQTFPLKWSQLKRELKASAWNDYEYLGRGVPFSQAEVRKRLGKPQWDRNSKVRGSVIIYREARGYRVVLGKRWTGNAPQA